MGQIVMIKMDTDFMIEPGELSTLQSITHTDISVFPVNISICANDGKLYPSSITPKLWV